jgi:serine/threonine protein kinase
MYKYKIHYGGIDPKIPNLDELKTILKDKSYVILGIGAFGEVVKIKYEDNYYALKIIDKQKLKTTHDDEFIDLSQDGISITGVNELDYSKIFNNCSHIIKTLSGYFIDGDLCILQELADTSLYNYINDKNDKKPSSTGQIVSDVDKSPVAGQIVSEVKKCSFTKLSSEEICRIIYELCIGLSCLHKNNLTHLDLKLENILLKDNKVKIADFGLVHFICSVKKTYNVLGTPGYIAPEMLGRPETNCLNKEKNLYASDIWSVGIIILILIFNCNSISIYTKIFPHILNPENYTIAFLTKNVESNIGNVIDEIKKTELKDKDILCEIILGCLKTNPLERYSAEQICSKLVKYKTSENEVGYLTPIKSAVTTSPNRPQKISQPIVRSPMKPINLESEFQKS